MLLIKNRYFPMKKLMLFIFLCLCFSFLGCEEENEILAFEEIKPTFDTVYSIKIKFLDNRCIKKYGVSNKRFGEIGETDLIDLNSNELTVKLDSFVISPQFRVLNTVQRRYTCNCHCTNSYDYVVNEIKLVNKVSEKNYLQT